MKFFVFAIAALTAISATSAAPANPADSIKFKVVEALLELKDRFIKETEKIVEAVTRPIIKLIWKVNELKRVVVGSPRSLLGTLVSTIFGLIEKILDSLTECLKKVSTIIEKCCGNAFAPIVAHIDNLIYHIEIVQNVLECLEDLLQSVLRLISEISTKISICLTIITKEIEEEVEKILCAISKDIDDIIYFILSPQCDPLAVVSFNFKN